MILQEVLEEAIRLRESGKPEQSLDLLDRAEAQGLQSPWLEDNRARALLALDRVEKACSFEDGIIKDNWIAVRFDVRDSVLGLVERALRTPFACTCSCSCLHQPVAVLSRRCQQSASATEVVVY